MASDPYSRTVGEQWKDNRGTQLFFLTCLIFTIGVAFLLYRQNRFVPVEFPGGDMFQGMDSSFNDASGASEPASASIVVDGASSDVGVLRIAIYDAAEGFNDLDYAVRKAKLPIQDGQSMTRIPVAILADSFAIAVFHDENENGSLDRNAFGIPTECYGFSNNARGLTGPPSFTDAKIDRPEPGQSIKISIR
ncbi:DUF2141 domain-containing protein [Rubripirellula obstinata]|uniref:DUF2141 domain-containing protein n=1 Tax=Rubripirellula obstinata TaxID=406547 RepID=UPI00190F7778|nr:DUF2141 domain-containing protein [Rubripirellula obstinata]